MKKMYCLVFIDDFSRFTWVFFLATKDETSGILKSFITGIENLVDHKVKVIRCDNGTEFKKREMNQFCEMKGILRQFSVARTPQQNGVAEKRNRTLIEAARTMLADSKSKTLSSDDEKKVGEVPRKESECNDQEKEDNVNNTNTVNAAGAKEIDEDDGAEADMNNLDTTIQVSPILTTRIHKDHHLKQVIRDLQSATQTINMSKNLKEHGFEEPKKVIHALKDPRWIEAMLEELLQFKLVAQGYTQEERIDYDEVFSPVARIKAIMLFLAYLSFKDFMVYQMDVKSAFLYGKIEEEVYVCQPPGFEDPDFPDRKELCNAFEKLMHEKFQMSCMGELTFFLRLQVQQKKDGIFISKDKYVVEILKKFGFIEDKTASTPMETQTPLLKDEDGEEVYVHMYRSMIGSLMYLTSLRPDIMFAVCACARYQVNPKVSHLHARESLDRKSTTGGCQFLGCRLISWQCKKQTVVENSITEAEYVAASSCHGQVLWIQNQLLDYGYNYTHNIVAFLSKPEESDGFEQIVDFLNAHPIKYALTVNPTIYTSCIEQFWSTVKAKTINGEVQLHALVDGKKIIVT
ncbi:retrovirus-related pol polyprotein from transposon TNT 1-94 [Tanacetum coccineum]